MNGLIRLNIQMGKNQLEFPPLVLKQAHSYILTHHVNIDNFI